MILEGKRANLKRPFCDSHQELPSHSANLSRPDTLPTLNFLSCNFGARHKNFNSQ
jgi:hypothetical protein